MSEDLQVTIVGRAVQAQDIVSLDLAAADGGPLPPFSAGAHIDLHLAPGLVRPYSLCSDPAQRHVYRIAVLRETRSRGGSEAVHARLQPGQALRVGRPRNRFPLAPSGAALLLAGGIGITPMLAMAAELHAQRRDFTLHYAARSLERMAFRDQLRQSPFTHRVRLHLDDGAPAQRLDAATVLAASAAGTHLYVCGPQGFIAHVKQAAADQGWDRSRVHEEHFAPAADAACAATGDRAFDLVLARSGRRIEVAAGATAAAALQAAGVALPLSCEQGVCGACATRVLQGEPDHRDLVLTPDEKAAGGLFTPCCSRAISPVLVLDL